MALPFFGTYLAHINPSEAPPQTDPAAAGWRIIIPLLARLPFWRDTGRGGEPPPGRDWFRLTFYNPNYLYILVALEKLI